MKKYKMCNKEFRIIYKVFLRSEFPHKDIDVIENYVRLFELFCNMYKYKIVKEIE